MVAHCDLLIDAKAFSSRLNHFHCNSVTPCSAKTFGKEKPQVIVLKRDGICKPLLRADGRGGRGGGERRLSSRTISTSPSASAAASDGGESTRSAVATAGGSS